MCKMGYTELRLILYIYIFLCVTGNKFHAEVTFLKDIFRKNAFPGFFKDRCIKVFLDKIFVARKSC